MSSVMSNSVNSLPDEIVPNVLRFIPFLDRMKFRGVSTAFDAQSLALTDDIVVDQLTEKLIYTLIDRYPASAFSNLRSFAFEITDVTDANPFAAGAAKHFKETEEYCINALSKLFRFFAGCKSLVNIRIHDLTDRQLDTISEHFDLAQVKRFTFSNHNSDLSTMALSARGLASLVAKCTTLEKLYVQDTSYLSEFADIVLRPENKLLETLTSLKLLRVYGLEDEAGMRTKTPLLTNLKSLQLAGVIALTDTSFHNICRDMTKLESINFFQCQRLSDQVVSTAIVSLKHLRSVSFRLCRVGQLTLNALASNGMRNLTFLDLTGTEIMDLSPLLKMKESLRTLFARCYRLTSIAPVSQLIGLEHLILGADPRVMNRDTISLVSTLTKLTRLDLQIPSEPSEESLMSMSSLVGLRELSLEMPLTITDEWLDGVLFQMPNMESAHLPGAIATDDQKQRVFQYCMEHSSN